MQLDVLERDDGLTHVALTGRLDVSGLHEVDIKFHGATAARRANALVDISGIDYIASLGMGMFISCAQSLQRHGFQMVLVGAQGDVDEALRTAGIDQGIPMVADADAALAVFA
jgi:anti-sigma B factor antagonist